MLRLPCPGGGCDAVLHSRWGVLLGVPVGLFGAALWLATFASGLRIRTLAHHALALGSIGFVAIQAFVIGRFCPWCLAHAMICWLAWPGRAAITRRPGTWAAVGFALAGLFLTFSFSTRRPVAVAEVSVAHELASTGFDWLRASDTSAASETVVVSLTCPLCLDLLENTPAPADDGPALVFLTSAENRELTELFVAAVRTHPAGAQDSFPALAALVLSQRDLVLARPADAARWFASQQPDAATGLADAAAKLAAQQAALTRAGVALTPVRVSATGVAETFSHWRSK